MRLGASLSATIALLGSVGLAGCSTSSSPQSRHEFPWREPRRDSERQSQALLEQMVERYATCRTYRDRGILIESILADGSWSQAVRYFDTAFVRERAQLRFRVLDERRRPLHALWSHDGRIVVRDSATTQEYQSFSSALAALRGVSRLISEVVPPLLVGLPPIPAEQAFFRAGPLVVGTAPPGCGRCVMLAFGSASVARQDVLTVDEIGAVRRFESGLRIASSGGARTSDASHDLALYEAEFDVADTEALSKEIATPPW